MNDLSWTRAVLARRGPQGPRIYVAPIGPAMDGRVTAWNEVTKAKQIIFDVAAEHGLKAVDLATRSHRPPLVRARQEAMYLLVRDTRLSLSQIGNLFGCHHSTVLYACPVHAQRAGLPILRREDRLPKPAYPALHDYPRVPYFFRFVGFRRRDAVLRLKRKGLPHAQIIAQIGDPALTNSMISNIAARARKRARRRSAR